MILQPTELDSSSTHLVIFLNLIEALSCSYLYDYSQVYVTLLCLLYVTLLHFNNLKLWKLSERSPIQRIITNAAFPPSGSVRIGAAWFAFPPPNVGGVRI